MMKIKPNNQIENNFNHFSLTSILIGRSIYLMEVFFVDDEIDPFKRFSNRELATNGCLRSDDSRVFRRWTSKCMSGLDSDL